MKRTILATLWAAWCMATASGVTPILSATNVVEEYAPRTLRWRAGGDATIETIYRYRNGTTQDLSGVTSVVMRYKGAEPWATNWYAVTGTVYSATGGITRTPWTTAAEAGFNAYEWESVVSGGGTFLREFGTLYIEDGIASHGGLQTNTALTTIDWATVMNMHPESGPWTNVSGSATNVSLADLTDTMTSNSIPVGNGADLVLKTPAQVRTVLELGTAATNAAGAFATAAQGLHADGWATASNSVTTNAAAGQAHAVSTGNPHGLTGANLASLGALTNAAAFDAAGMALATSNALAAGAAGGASFLVWSNSAAFTNDVRLAQTNAPGGGGGDNLGNHTATTDILIGTNAIRGDNGGNAFVKWDGTSSAGGWTMQGSLDLLVQGGSGLTNLHIGATDARLMTNSYVSAWTYDGSGTASNEIIRRDVMESYVANNGGSGTDTNAWHIGDSVTGAEDSVARAWGNHATNGYLTTGDGVGTVLRSYGTAQTELAISNGLRVVDGSIQSAITFQATNLPAGQIPLPPDINTGTGQITFSIGTNLPAASVVGNVTGAVYAATAGSAGSALSGWPTTWAGSAITSVVAQATSAANAANATNLNGQAAGYYLNGANITNVPAAWLATTQITWTATQNAGAQAVTNVATVGFTNSITLKSGSLGGTNGIYFTDNGTNYWILKPTL